MVKFRHFLEKFYVAIIFVLLYLPIAVLTVMSFNNSRYMKWGGFTLRWYEDLFTSGPIMEALRNTLLLALLSALIATAVGTLACVGILYMRKRSQSAIMSVNSIPLLNADIVTGIALMLLFVRMFGNLNFTTMLIAHISFNIPYVVLNVLPKLRQRDRNTYEAAVDLGATPVQAFFKVIVPDIFPGILSGFLMAFTMSLDDFTITYFTKGAGIKTLSIIIYTERKLGNQPELYALSTIIFLIVLIVLFVVNRISINKEKARQREKTIDGGRKMKKICFCKNCGGCYGNCALPLLHGRARGLHQDPQYKCARLRPVYRPRCYLELQKRERHQSQCR